MSRPLAYLASAASLAAVLYPILLDPQDPKQDSFPLSTYPMFSYDKPREVQVTSAAAIGGGRERPIPPEFVANSETMQALRTIEKSVRAGRKHARRLCKSIAARIADSSDPEFAFAERVSIATIKVDSIRYLSGDRTPLERHEHVRCRIPRSARP